MLNFFWPRGILSLLSGSCRPLDFIAFIAVLSVSMFYLLLYHFSFNYEVAINYNYYVYVVSILFFFISLVISLTVNEPFGNLLPRCLMLVIVLILLLLCDSNNEHWSNFAVVVFVLCSCAVANNRFMTSNCNLLIFVLQFLYQIYEGISQFLNKGAMEATYSVNGTIGNSGIYAIYIVISFPLFLHFVREISYTQARPNVPKAWYNILPICLSIVVLLGVTSLIFVVRSRIAIIMMCLLVVPVLISNSQLSARLIYKKWRKFLLLGVSFLVIVAPIGIKYLLSFKRPSVSGRLLIWKITGNHLIDNFWSGIGFGKFGYIYPKWQAEYFGNNQNIGREYILSAGESYVGFNEYITLFVEIGLIPTITVGFIILLFFLTRSEQKKRLLYNLKLTVGLTLISAFTSYPFHCNIINLIFFMSIATGFAIDERLTLRIWSGKQSLWMTYRILSLSSSFIVLIVLVSSLRKTLAVYEWQYLRKNRSSMERIAVTEKYKQLGQILDRDGKFLIYQAEDLMLYHDRKELIKALDLLHHASRTVTNIRLYKDMGTISQELEDFRQAEACYKFISDFVPNKFGYRLLLMNLYKADNNLASARIIAIAILNMPVKKYSYEVERIKAQAVSTIELYSQSLN